MKKKNVNENTFIINLTTISFIVIMIISLLFANKNIIVFGFDAPIAAIIYPFIYLLTVIFYERFGKEKTFNLFIYTVFSLILVTVILNLMSGVGPKENMITVEFQTMFAFITSFIFGNTLNLILYNILENKKASNFFISSMVAITFDAMLFLLLNSIGTDILNDIFGNFVGRYIICILVLLVDTFIFYWLIKHDKGNKKMKVVNKEKIVKPKKETQK